MKKTRLSFRKSRWQRSDTNEIKPDYNNAFTVLGVLLTELANAAAAVLLTVCAVSVVNTTVSHVRCPYYVYVWLFIFSVIKYSLQGTTQSRYLTGGVPPVRFSM